MNERSFKPPDDPALAEAAGHLSRQRILDTAYHLFLRQGFHGTSMRQIARQAGISPATIYNHFVSKEALFTALLGMHLPQRALAGALAQARGSGADELVHDALRRMGETMANQYDNLRLVFVELLEFQGRHVGEVAAEILPGVLEVVARLQKSDRRLRSLDPLMIVRVLGGLFMSHAITVAFFGQVPGLKLKTEDLDALGDLFLYGVLDERQDRAMATSRGSNTAG